MRALILSATILAATFGSGLAEAGHRRDAPAGGTVIAESRFGNGSVTGAVRNTELGPQVQLPNGHWEYCRRSCSETLRVETVDFAEKNAQTLGGGGLANECGIFGCIEIGRRWRD